MARGLTRTPRHADPTSHTALNDIHPNDWPWADYYHDKRRVDRCVYALHIPEIRRIKIGYAGNVPRRIRAIKRAHPELAPFRFDVIGTINGGRAMERVIHERYASHRVSGEWFDDAILEDVQALIAEDGEWFGEFA